MRLARGVALGFVLATTALPAAAQSLLTPNEWLPDGSNLGIAVAERPRQVLRIEQDGGTPSFVVRLGELTFRSAEILGGNARKAGISCDTCHLGGASNSHFFIPGLSSKPGTVDVSHRLWNHMADDGLDNPVAIPSLRGVGDTAPYGFRGEFASLREFTRKVIVQEFAGEEPPPLLLDALVAYENELVPLPNPALDRDGKLAGAAPAEVRNGEAIFRRNCAACHQPEYGFVDFRRHDVGTGGPVDTPSLLNLRVAGPFLHDGHLDSLESAVAYFVRQTGAKLSAPDEAALVAYLRTISGGKKPSERVTLAGDLVRLGKFVALVRTPLLDEDAGLAEVVTRMLRGEIGRIHSRFHAPAHEAARQVLLGWSRSLAEIDHLAATRNFPQARVVLAALERHLREEAGPLNGAEPTSLYNPDVLRTVSAAAKQDASKPGR